MYDTILSCPNCGLEHRLVADNVVEHRDALIRAGDVLATRLDETPANTSALLDVAAAAKHIYDVAANWVKQDDSFVKLAETLDALDSTDVDRKGQQAVREWLAIAHPEGKGHSE
jgi:hypothetical protein